MVFSNTHQNRFYTCMIYKLSRTSKIEKIRLNIFTSSSFGFNKRELNIFL